MTNWRCTPVYREPRSAKYPIHREIAAPRKRLTSARTFGRFISAGVSLELDALVGRTGTLGKQVALTAIAFGIGLLVIPFALETRGKPLPD